MHNFFQYCIFPVQFAIRDVNRLLFITFPRSKCLFLILKGPALVSIEFELIEKLMKIETFTQIKNSCIGTVENTTKCAIYCNKFILLYFMTLQC